MEEVYGFAAPLPFGVDFVTYSNEDLGVEAAYAAGADVKRIALPYPSSMNLWRETMIVFAIEFIEHAQANPTNGVTALGGQVAHLSMLDKRFGDNWDGVLADAEDEAWKAQFAGPIWFGKHSALVTAVGNLPVIVPKLDANKTALYFPPVPLDIVTPLFIQLTNQAVNITLAEGSVTRDDDANPSERTTIRVWFIKRDFTSLELAFLQRLPTRFQQLDS